LGGILPNFEPHFKGGGVFRGIFGKSLNKGFRGFRGGERSIIIFKTQKGGENGEKGGVN
jgi:hypothetical protein